MAGKGLTGVTASDNSIALFTDFKKSSNPLRFAIFYIVDGKIEVENSSEGKDFDEFTNLLPSDDCRYALYKNNYITNDGRDGEKIVSVLW
jgi:cofilin